MQRKPLLLALLILVLIMATLRTWQAAWADTYVVTNTNDSGPGSLRQTITDANNHPGADTITFAASTNGTPIILAGAAGEDANTSGDLDILDGGDLTIQGNSPANTIIDGNFNDRVFHICPGGGCANTITFSGLTIRRGVVTSGGGGIRNEAGTTIVDASTIRYNAAINGGGISNFATLIIQNGSAIGVAGAGNLALSNGGGIYNYAGTLTLDDSTVSLNSATNNGGGIWNQATLNVQNGSLIGGAGVGNTANNNGGGIFNYDAGVVTVDGSTVSANSATIDGGGIFNWATLNVQNGSTIGGAGAGNSAEDDGGGIYNTTGGIATIDDSNVSANSTTVDGGGIFNAGSLNVQNGSTIGGIGAGNTADDDGGGIYNISGGVATIDNSLISTNIASDDGGGIANFATLIVQNGSSVNANAANVDGGGIFNSAVGITTVQDSTVSANLAERGGGIYNDNGTTTVNSSIINANAVTVDGGGIYNDAWLNVLNGSIIGESGAGNSASRGGGIYIDDGTTTVDSSTVNANSATLDGGGIYSYGGTTTVIGSRILNNSAGTNGGGVFSNIDSLWSTSVISSCIVGNSDVSFINNELEEQIATGNWWGAPLGPNTSGADTVAGNVDYSGFLNVPILGCAPDLQVSKVNDTGGSGSIGMPFHWTLTVANSGLISATFNTGEIILVDELPAGPTYGSPLVGNFMDISNSANIHCNLAGNTLTCEPTGGSVALGPVSGSFEVTVSVTPNASVTLVNPAGTCQVDPDGVVTESDESNNNCPQNVVDVTSPATYLPLVLR